MKTINLITKKIRRAAFCLILLTAAAAVTFSSFATQSAMLTWNPSSTPDATGYKIYYGTVSATYTNVVSVGAVTNAAISGLTAGVTYYFAVTTCNSNLSLESVPSNEISYTVPDGATLAIQATQANGLVTSVSVTATGAVPAQWVLESSADLKNWMPRLHGTNVGVTFSMAITDLPAQFFRLKSE